MNRRLVSEQRFAFRNAHYQGWEGERQLSGRRVAIADVAGLQLFPRGMVRRENFRRLINGPAVA
ncbi:hypothetical protein ASE49_03035 [Novosphingobium sp. Leaf2]|nr:hypothetical protein ASE49_03035 [Novosphingobium sp. Leaf2]